MLIWGKSDNLHQHQYNVSRKAAMQCTERISREFWVQSCTLSSLQIIYFIYFKLKQMQKAFYLLLYSYNVTIYPRQKMKAKPKRNTATDNHLHHPTHATSMSIHPSRCQHVLWSNSALLKNN